VESYEEFHSKGSAKIMTETNALAYHVAELIRAVKSFLLKVPDPSNSDSYQSIRITTPPKDIV
jgi:hypothetical protein